MAMRTLMVSKVFRVDGNSPSSMTWFRKSKCTGLDGPPCRAKVDGAGSKVFSPGCSSLGCAPAAGSKGVGLGVGDPLLLYLRHFCVREWDWCQVDPASFGVTAGLSLSPSVLPLLPLPLGCCAPMSSMPGLAVRM